MVISEFIRELEKIKEEKGDLIVGVEERTVTDFKVSIQIKKYEFDRVIYEKHPRLTRIEQEAVILSCETARMIKAQREKAIREAELRAKNKIEDK